MHPHRSQHAHVGRVEACATLPQNRVVPTACVAPHALAVGIPLEDRQQMRLVLREAGACTSERAVAVVATAGGRVDHFVHRVVHHAQERSVVHVPLSGKASQTVGTHTELVPHPSIPHPQISTVSNPPPTKSNEIGVVPSITFRSAPELSFSAAPNESVAFHDNTSVSFARMSLPDPSSSIPSSAPPPRLFPLRFFRV